MMMHGIWQYMWNRELRKRDVVTLLEEADFYVDEESTTWYVLYIIL